MWRRGDSQNSMSMSLRMFETGSISFRRSRFVLHLTIFSKLHKSTTTMYRKPEQLSPSVVFASMAVSLSGLTYYI